MRPYIIYYRSDLEPSEWHMLYNFKTREDAERYLLGRSWPISIHYIIGVGYFGLDGR